MKFLKLNGQNFLALSHFAIALDERGLNLIQGANDDDSSASSNGAGKSSLVDAICWCLFGSTARGAKGDAVVNRAAKKNTAVTLTLEDGSVIYEVSRYRKHAEHKNMLQLKAVSTTGLVDLTKGTDAETQKEVERVLGCSEEVFKAAVYSGQEIMPDLPRMTDRELKRLIEEAAGLQRIERAYEIARERRIEAQNKAVARQSKVESAETQVARSAMDIEALVRDEGQWEEQRAARVAQTAEQQSLVSTELRAAALKALALKPDSDAASVRIGEIDTLLAEHRALTARATALSAEAVAAERAVERHALNIESRRVKEIDEEIANIDVEMAKPCPECGKPHTPEERDDYLAHRTKFRADMAALLEATKRRVVEQLRTLQAANEAHAAAVKAIPDVSALTTERTTCVAKINDYQTSLNELTRLKASRTALDSQKALRESEPNPFTPPVLRARAQLTEDEARLAVLRTESADARKALEVADAVVKVFGPAGVRAEILDTVTPYLNARTAEYLGVLSDGNISAAWSTLTKSAAGDLKEKFSIEVNHAKGGDSFALISGGEKRKVRLATALALQDLVASRATKPLDLWIGDEIDDALDPAGLERLMVILDLKAREHGTVLVISHSDLRDWVDNVTIVRKTEQWKSVVEGALSETE